jgi:hypothetical protein
VEESFHSDRSEHENNEVRADEYIARIAIGTTMMRDVERRSSGNTSVSSLSSSTHPQLHNPLYPLSPRIRPCSALPCHAIILSVSPPVLCVGKEVVRMRRHPRFDCPSCPRRQNRCGKHLLTNLALPATALLPACRPTYATAKRGD